MKPKKQVWITILLIIAVALAAGKPIRSFAADETGLQPSFRIPQTGSQTGFYPSFNIWQRTSQAYFNPSFNIWQRTSQAYSNPSFNMWQRTSQAYSNPSFHSLPGFYSYGTVSYRAGLLNSGTVLSFSVPQYRTAMPDISRLTMSDFTSVLFRVNGYRNNTTATPAPKPASNAAPKPASNPAPKPAPNPAPEPASNPASRTVFFGDSRTVQMFNNSRTTISGELHDGILVIADSGAKFDDMKSRLNQHGMESFDTLISWMGGNDGGNFAPYQSYYEGLLAEGKHLVLCTVGPTSDASFPQGVNPIYFNARILEYNNQLKAWSANNGVKVIDLYSFIQSESSILFDADGVHYSPKPNPVLWNYILSCLKP